MKLLIAAAVLACACKPTPPVPEVEAPMERNRAEKYVSGLQADVKRAQEAKDKADAANKKAEEAKKLPE